MKLSVTILSGFLGSGKTTLLNHLLEQFPAQKTALILNDFGDINLDLALVSNKNLQSFSLAGGCICCSIRGNLTKMVTDISQKDDIDTLLIECSGIADPSAILTTLLSPLLRNRLEVQAVITVVDALNFMETLATQKKLLEAQIKTATTVLINKIDTQPQSTIGEITQHIHALNNTVPIIPSTFGNTPASLLTKVVPIESITESDTLPEAGLHSLSFELKEDLTITTLKKFLQNVPRGIFRAKAIYTSKESATAIAIHRVGRRVTTNQLNFTTEKNSIVLIGDEESINQLEVEKIRK